MLYSNRSMGHFKVSAFESALADGLEAIEQDPQWFKGYYNASKVNGLFSLRSAPSDAPVMHARL